MGFDVTHTGNTQTRLFDRKGEGNRSDGENPKLDNAAACTPEIRSCCWGLVHGLLRWGHSSQTKTNPSLYIYHYVTRNGKTYEGADAVFKLF